MALIINCKICDGRLPAGAAKCPKCGGTRFSFIVDYWPQGRYGKRIREPLPAATASIADAWEIERLMRQMARDKIKPPVPSGNTVDELFDDYLKWYKLHRAPTTYKDIVLIHRAHLSRLLGGNKVSLIGTEQFDYYQKMRALENVTNRTINKELHYISGFLKWCRQHKKIAVAPFTYEKLPYKRPTPIVLTHAEIIKILQAAQDNPLYYTLILCLYSLGLRVSEACNLKLSNIDFGSQSVKMIQKGGTEKTLPLNNLLIKALRTLIRNNRLKDNDYLFLNPMTGAPIGNPRKAIARIARSAGIRKNVHPHIFRHTWATHLLGQGVDIRVIQKFLGHSQLSTTEIYTHVVLGNLRTASNAVLDRMRDLQGVSAKNKVKSVICLQPKHVNTRNH